MQNKETTTRQHACFFVATGPSLVPKVGWLHLPLRGLSISSSPLSLVVVHMLLYVDLVCMVWFHVMKHDNALFFFCWHWYQLIKSFWRVLGSQIRIATVGKDTEATETDWLSLTPGHLVCDFCYRGVYFAAPAEHHQLVWTWIPADLSRPLVSTFHSFSTYGGFHKWGYPQMIPNGWFVMENPIKMDDLGVPLFQETSVAPPLPCLSRWCLPTASICAAKQLGSSQPPRRRRICQPPCHLATDGTLGDSFDTRLSFCCPHCNHCNHCILPCRAISWTQDDIDNTW